MAKVIEYDISGVEESGGGTGVKVKPGLRVARIAQIEQRTEKSDGSPANDLKVAFDFGEDYDWIFTYIGLSKATDWKLAEFLRALGLPERGKFDPDKQKDKTVLVMVKSDEYEGQYSPRAGKLFKAPKGAKVGEPISFSANGAAADPEPTDESANDHGVPPAEPTDICREDPDDPEIGSYDDWPEEDLTAELEARGLTLPGGRGSITNKAIKALRADDEAADEPGSDPDPDIEGSDPNAAPYEEWETDELIAEYEARGFPEPVPAKPRGRTGEARQREAIITALEADDNGDPFGA